MAHALLISDLHLARNRPRTLADFQAFLSGPASQAQALYILGDLFDAWIGDDDPEWRDVTTWLRSLSDGGVHLYIQRGNRDFLIGADFLDATGATLLDDEARASLPCGPALLMHGDTLCSDDTRYQQARLLLRNPDFIADFLARPLEERRIIADEYRRRSGEATSLLAEDIMDVNQDAVIDALRRHGLTTLIHGHTHRPDRHDFVLDGRAATRWVLPEWRPGQPGWLHVDANGARFRAPAQ